MDKLKAALSGRETLHNEDEESGFVSQVGRINVRYHTCRMMEISDDGSMRWLGYLMMW